MIKKIKKKNSAIFQKMKNCNFPRVFSCFFIFFIALSFFIIFASSGGIDEKWFSKNDEKWFKKNNNDKNNDKQMKKKWKNSRKIEIFQKKFQKMKFFSFSFFSFLIFLSCFYHFCFQWWNWCKMIKNEKMKKKWLKNGKKSRKIVIFHFLENFCTTGSKNDEKW